MLSGRSPDPENIAAALDRLSHAERLIALRGLERDQLRLLYTITEGFAPMTLSDLVPPETPPLQAVRHIGRNSLPLFSLFEKRFYRLEKQTDQADQAAVGGANFQSTSALTGPGYFLASAATDRAEIIIDYSRIPSQAPAGWPALAGNEHGMGQLVYGGMIDTLRRISKHVSIGAAQKSGHKASAYFTLCRLADGELGAA